MNQMKNALCPITKPEIQSALQLILEDSQWLHAVRLRRLLSFLIDKVLTDATSDLNEYAIGIVVFDRNPDIYSTCDDSIVRTQMWRLRTKLERYYAGSGTDSTIEISIPAGAYLPVIRRRNCDNTVAKQHCLLPLQPLKCITHPEENVLFIQGLNEELLHQLFKTFERGDTFFTFIDAEPETGRLNQLSSFGIKHLLTGSILIDAERLRVCIRLMDVLQNHIVWSEQFDRSEYFSIAHQEDLAVEICGALKQYFASN